MPFPKLSAVFNNCPLHALTPEIKEQVLRFAAIKGYDNGHNDQYEQLKVAFATFYDIDPTVLDWQQLAGILNSYNAFDTQIILGPVLRLYMKDEVGGNEDIGIIAMTNDMSVEQYLAHLTEVNPANARYFSLSPDEVAAYVAKQLGFNIEYHPQLGAINIIHATNPISTIGMFHSGGAEGAEAGGHWERTNNGEGSIDYKNAADTQLLDISNLLGNELDLNEVGLRLLKNHMRLTLNGQAILGTDVFAEANAEVALTAAQISKYIHNVRAVPKNMAIDLLGGNLTEGTLAFIQHYNAFVPVNSDDYNARYVRAAPAQRVLMNPSEFEKDLLDYILRPVPMPEPAARRLDAYRTAQSSLDEGISPDEWPASEHFSDGYATDDGSPSVDPIAQDGDSDEQLAVDPLDLDRGGHVDDHQAERVAAELAEQQRLAAEQAARELAEQQRLADEKVARELAEQQRLAAEQAARVLAEQQRVATEQAARVVAEQQRLATEHAARELAEQQRLAAVQARRSPDRSVEIVARKKLVNDALQELSVKIDTLPKNSKQYTAAKVLLNELTHCSEEFLKNPLDKTVQRAFKKDCTEAINSAKPILATEPEWGAYLNTLMRKIANAVAPYITFGQKKSFFTIDKTNAEKAVEKYQRDVGIEDNGESHKPG